MAEKRRRATRAAVGDGNGENPPVVLKLSPEEVELARRKLRQRWELATVINFLHVFEPVIETKLKISAEEIETALITPNNLLSELHIALLKGIPPTPKTLSGSDAWVTVLCKKLSPWWPWVSEGNIPLTAAKGEEISKYKELDPTARLQLLRALCEVRADQNDAVEYMTDAQKGGAKVPFRKEKIAGDDAGTIYWSDGNTVVGHRLYKEVRKFEFKPKVKGEVCLPKIISEWETLATNLEEFQEVVDQFSSSEVAMEIAVAKAIEADVLPVVERIQKKKERAAKQQQRQEILLNGFRNSGITRSCRNRRPVNYTFDDYDKTINEAIQLTKRSKTTTDEQKQEEKPIERVKEEKAASSEGSDTETDSKSSSDEGHNSRNSSADKEDAVASDTESEELQEGHHDDDDDDEEDEEHDSEEDDGNYEDDNHSGDSDMETDEPESKSRGKLSKKKTGRLDPKSFGCRWSTRLAKGANHPPPETNNMSTKNRTRQRPTRNSALESKPVVVSDSEDEQTSGSSGSERSSSPEVAEDSDS